MKLDRFATLCDRFIVKKSIKVVAATECTPGWVDLTVTPGSLSKEIARATILEHLEPLKYHFEHLQENTDLQYKLNDNGYLEHVAMNKATLGRTIRYE